MVWLDFLWSIIKTSNWTDDAWSNQSTEMQMDDRRENTTLICRKTQGNTRKRTKPTCRTKKQPDHQQKEEEWRKQQHTTPTEQLRPIREEEEEEEEEEGETGATASERPPSSSSSSSQSSSARTNHRDTLLTKHPATAPLTAWQEEERRSRKGRSLQTTDTPTAKRLFLQLLPLFHRMIHLIN